MNENEQFVKDMVSMLDTWMQEAMAQFHAKFMAHVRSNLQEIGYAFTSDDEFDAFCKTRLVLIKRGYEQHVYLGYKTEDEPGLLIAWCNTKTKIRHDPDGSCYIEIGGAYE